METKHTAGPWTVNSNIGKHGELGIVAAAVPCVIAHGFSEKHWPIEAQANAALIAAAPELLELLQWALDDQDSEVLGVEWNDKARAAIAKATGGA